MGRLIDADVAYYAYKPKNCSDEQWNLTTLAKCILNAPTVDAIPKADYEARLKADMVAMLTEIQLEIEELNSNHTMPDVWSNQVSKEIWNTALKLIEEIIEVRINNLKGMTKDGKESG